MTFQPRHLGNSTDYPTAFDATLLEAIPRAPGRESLSINQHALPFLGWDDWQAFEMGWLNANGQGVAGVLTLRFSAVSESIVESKSLKLYLQSFHMTSFTTPDQVKSQIQQDLAECLNTQVILSLQVLPSNEADLKAWHIKPWATTTVDSQLSEFEKVSLDALSFPCSIYQPDRSLLQLDASKVQELEQKPHFYFTEAFRSLCPVTGQPDFASVGVVVQGLALNAESLGQYFNSFRLHQGFHEQCVEHIFIDLLHLGDFKILSVVGRFTRRGGIDINPIRHLNQASEKLAAQFQRRQWRQ